PLGGSGSALLLFRACERLTVTLTPYSTGREHLALCWYKWGKIGKSIANRCDCPNFFSQPRPLGLRACLSMRFLLVHTPPIPLQQGRARGFTTSSLMMRSTLFRSLV